MQRKSMITALVAAAFALPLAATAGGLDKTTGAKSASAMNDTHGASADAKFKSADTNADGFVSMEEANGTPHAAIFASLDTNGDGKLSQEEHATSKDYVAVQPGAKIDAVTTGTADTSAVRK